MVHQQRDVSRAEDKVQAVVSDLYDLQSEMEAALIDEAEKFGPDAFEVQKQETRPRERDVDIELCALVWVPYWVRPDGSRRRAT